MEYQNRCVRCEHGFAIDQRICPECFPEEYEEESKVCIKCSRELPAEEFSEGYNGKLRGDCKECHREACRKANANRRKTGIGKRYKWAGNQRTASGWAREFGVTPKQFRTLLERFGFQATIGLLLSHAHDNHDRLPSQK